MKVDIGLPEKNCKEIAQLLNEILSNVFVLYVKSLNYHWNLKGPDFDAIHAFFKRIYEELFDVSDEVAERVQQLGGVAYGTLGQFKDNASITEDIADGAQKQQMAMIEQLLKDYETLIKQMRKAIPVIQDDNGDLGTGNFLTDIMERLEKTAWMLRSFFPPR